MAKNATAVTAVRPDPRAWAIAVDIVGKGDGDVRRIQVLDELNLVVWNRPTRMGFVRER